MAKSKATFEANYNSNWAESLAKVSNFNTGDEIDYQSILNDPTKKDFLIAQYNSLILVYLKNHDEYRKIQSQLIYYVVIYVTIMLATLVMLPLNYLGVIIVQLLMAIIAWFLKTPMIVSITKNRLFHKFTAFTIRSIEDALSFQNIPLRSAEFCDELQEAMRKHEDKMATKSAGRFWVQAINVISWLIPISISVLLAFEIVPKLLRTLS